MIDWTYLHMHEKERKTLNWTKDMPGQITVKEEKIKGYDIPVRKLWTNTK